MRRTRRKDETVQPSKIAGTKVAAYQERGQRKMDKVVEEVKQDEDDDDGDLSYVY